MSSQEGGWLSHTYYNNKLCMKSAKTEFKYLPFFGNNNTQFQLQSEKNITTMQIPRQPSCRLTGVQPLLRKSASATP